jgi:hypothetical protein
VEAGRPTLIGGPLDGASIAPGPRPPFVWCGALAGNRVKCFTKPAANRELYRSVSLLRWLYAGHTHTLCEGCGIYTVARAARCGLCGHELAPAAR